MSNMSQYFTYFKSCFSQFLIFPSNEKNENLAQLIWLIRLRWFAVFFYFCYGVFLIVNHRLQSVHTPIFIGTIACLLLFNLLSHLVWGDYKKSVNGVVIVLHLILDMIALISLIFLSGNIDSPFLMLFFLNLSLAGLLIPQLVSWLFFFFAHTLLFLIQIDYMQENRTAGFSTQLEMISIHISGLCFWIVMRSLGRYLEDRYKEQNNIRQILSRQDRLRALGALTAGFSHEFASPLNNVKLRLERLLREDKKNVDVIAALESVSDCENVIQDMNLSQLDASDFIKLTVNGQKVLSDIVKSWLEQNSTADVELIFFNVEKIDLPVLSFSQVILNLLDNAFESEPNQKIKIQFEKNSTTVCLTVEDQGKGFDLGILERVGEPFITTKNYGVGLGLYVAQLFVDSYGGSLKVKNGTVAGCKVILQWMDTN